MKSEDIIVLCYVVTMKCIQINLQRCGAATTEVLRLREKYPYDILLFQEPHFYNKKVIGFPLNFNVNFKECERPKTGIALVNPLLNAINNCSSTEDDLSVSIVNCDKRKIAFLSCYCSPSESISGKLLKIEKAINSLPTKDFIIAIDSNAHSKIWDDRREDRRGDKVNEFIASNNLILLNNGNRRPTFENRRGYSNIDLTLCSVNISDKVKNWKVLDEISASDHNYIYFEIDAKLETVVYKTLSNTKLKIIRTGKC